MRITLAGASSVDAMIDTLSRQPGIEYVEKEPLYTVSVNDPQV
jgi:hypothetical protein